MEDRQTTPTATSFGTPWLLLCLAFAMHVWDEAAHDFLSYYNSTVLALYGHFSWLPRMAMQFRTWLAALLVGESGAAGAYAVGLSKREVLRPLAYVLAGIQC